jgi:hypothetical protein
LGASPSALVNQEVIAAAGVAEKIIVTGFFGQGWGT